MFIVFFLLWAMVYSPILHSQEDTFLAKRIYAHLELQDIQSALFEAEEALQHYPQSKILLETYLIALCKEGNARKIGAAWKKYKDLFPEPYKNRELLEAMSWEFFTLPVNLHPL